MYAFGIYVHGVPVWGLFINMILIHIRHNISCGRKVAEPMMSPLYQYCGCHHAAVDFYLRSMMMKWRLWSSGYGPFLLS